MIIKTRKTMAWLAILMLIATSVGTTFGFVYSNHWSAILQFLVLIPTGMAAINILRSSIVIASEHGIFIHGRFYSIEDFDIKGENGHQQFSVRITLGFGKDTYFPELK